MFTMPACPHPVRITSPLSVATTSDMSSGIESGRRPSGVTIRVPGLQFRSLLGRGTGPVSHTPGASSTGLSCTTNTAPVRSRLSRSATIGFSSRSLPSSRRLRKIPGATWMRESAGGLAAASARRSASSPPVWSAW